MATFATRPSENADPWYSAREAYDQSVEAAVNANETAIAAKADAAALTAHTSDTANPHGVTAAQVGALATADAPELIRDTMGTALVAGSNITITPDDAADTITIAAAGGGGVAALLAQTWGVGTYLRSSMTPLPVDTVTAGVRINTHKWTPLYVPIAASVDRIAVEVATADVAGSFVRLGIFTFDGTTMTLVIDAGTVPSDTTGVREAVIAQALPAGMYWIGATANNSNTWLRGFDPPGGLPSTALTGAASGRLWKSGKSSDGWSAAYSGLSIDGPESMLVGLRRA